MPKFDLDIPHALPAAEVRTRLERATGKLENEYGATCTWRSERELVVARKGLSASVRIEDARLHVDVELGLLMSPMSGAIKSGITKRLTELLSTPAA